MQPQNPLAPPNTAPLQPGDLIDEKEAAEILGVSLKTMRNWRWRGEGGPRARKLGARLVRYHRGDLAAFAAGEVA